VIGSGFARFWALLLWVSVFIVLPVPQTYAQQISVAPSALGFGNVRVGASQSQAVTITNTSTQTVTVSWTGVYGTGFSISGLTYPLSLAPGTSAVLSVTFAPLAVGSDTGSVWVRTSATGRRYRRRTASAALTGTGIATTSQITASPAALSFGSLSTGKSQTLSVTLANAGSRSVTVSGASVSSGAFTVSGLTLPASLSAGHSLTFSVVYSPTASGATSGQLAITSNASNSQLNIALSGSGASPGQLSLSPGTLNFGSVATGSSAALAGTLAATGSSVTVSSINSTSAEFVVSGITLPLSLAAGKSMPFTVTFRPQASGTATASLSFLSNAASSPTQEVLIGSGAGAVQHSVSLSWNPSTTSGVAGYNLYRGTMSGGPYAQVVSRDANPSYTDASVAAGQTYFYVVTAVDSAGTESVNSNQVQAVVPSP
jgi:hypothetical protein